MSWLSGRPVFARFWPLATLALWYVALGLVLRLVLWVAFGVPAQVAPSALAWLLPAGIAADAVQSLYLLAPFALFLWLVPDRWYRSRGAAAVVLGGAFLWMVGLTFVAAVQYFFFEEFDSRFNLVSVDYLMYPTEVAGDIWAEYPVVRVLLAAAAASAAAVWLLRGSLLAGRDAPVAFAARTRGFAAFATALSLAAAFFATDTVARSGSRVANQLAANGESSFFHAMRTSEIDYHAYYASADRAANLRLLARQLGRGGGRFVRLEEGRLDRAFPARPDGLGKLNVVILASESFGAEFSRLYGSERDWTPAFDRLAKDSLWFSNVYASGTRTVRGLEAITTSFPPIPSVSIVRRPGNDDIATLGKVLRGHGYHTSFLYGGYGYFDNMNAFYAANGFDVRDRNQVPKPVRFENIWGVADEDLYDMALGYFDRLAAEKKPFFSIVMNTSNHKPFTFRAGVPGVRPTGGGRESGVRYADYSLGYFVREAAKHPWFDDTLIVIVADHGARVYGRQEIPLKTYEIPMLIHAPKHLEPRRVDTLMTQIDIAPTIMGMLGLPYTAPFFGQDVLHTEESDRVAFFSHNHDVALYRNGELAILGLQKTIKNVRYDRATNTYQDAPPNPELNALAIAYYQTAFELFRAHAYE
jgi:phosphoglycerol transferase MdoB-like AlkP superfamily enzyme